MPGLSRDEGPARDLPWSQLRKNWPVSEMNVEDG